MATGNSWTYRVTDGDGETSTKQTIVYEETKVGGSGTHKDELAFFVVTSKSEGTDKSESWQRVEGDTVIRLRELSYTKSTAELELDEDWEPSKLHVDGSPKHTRKGASFLLVYTEHKTPPGGSTQSSEERDLWTVLDEAVEVTVPAGKFSAIHLQKEGGSSVKEYWYARGVGKVKETGSQTEELTEYSLAAD